jgi:hypothetical protein
VIITNQSSARKGNFKEEQNGYLRNEKISEMKNALDGFFSKLEIA